MSNEVTYSSGKMPISKVLASNGIKELAKNINLTQDQMRKAASNAMRLSADPKLSKCDSFSLAKFCFETARYDFVRDDSVYPVPYGNSVQAQISYKGYVELAMRSGKYREINATVVTTADTIKVNPLTGKAEVTFCDDYDKRVQAEPVGYYAYALDKDGKLVACLYMSKAECEKHGHKYSVAYNRGTPSPWKDDFDKMAKKTVIKQMYKDLDVTPLMEQAIKTDQYCFSGESSKGGYFDNPNSHDVIDLTADSGEEEKKTTVKNTLAKPKKEAEKAKEEPEAENKADLTDEEYADMLGIDLSKTTPSDDENPF